MALVNAAGLWYLTLTDRPIMVVQQVTAKSTLGSAWDVIGYILPTLLALLKLLQATSSANARVQPRECSSAQLPRKALTPTRVTSKSFVDNLRRPRLSFALSIRLIQ